ncbi:MAG: hypothetical protein V4724_26580 [Pseudomonadota bacterium]
MALDFNLGYLEHSGRVVSSFPCTEFGWMWLDAATGGQFLLTQGQSNADRYMAAWLDSNGTSKYANMRNPGNGSSATSSHGTVTGAWCPYMAVYASTTSRTIYVGAGDTGTPDTATRIDDLNLHDRITIGAYHVNGNSPSLFADGSLAEQHFYNVALTTASFNTLAAGALPETIAGHVDGLSLEFYSAGGTYVSINGLMNMTASGGITQSAHPHPVSRTSPNATAPGATLTGTATIVGGTATGGAAGAAPGATLTGTSSLTPGAASAINIGTITTDPFKNWNNIVQAGITIPNVVALKLSDRSAALSLANQVTNGSGVLTIASASLIAGTDYMLATFNADGSARGIKKYRAT